MTGGRSGGRARRVFGMIGVSVLLALGSTLPAAAHNGLVSTVPADSGSVARTPSEIVLTFDQPAVAMGTQVAVTGPTGAVQLGPPRLVDDTVSQSLQPGAPAGTYTVAWRVTSSDGHPISDTFTFTSAAAGIGQAPGPTAAPRAPLSPSAAAAVAPWVWWTAAAALLAAAAAVLWRLRRRPVG